MFNAAVGATGIPVNVGEANGALVPRAVVTVEANDASSLIAAANSFNVSSVAGAASTIAAAAVDVLPHAL